MTGLVYTALYWCIRGLDHKFSEDRYVGAAIYKRTKDLPEAERAALSKELRADPKFVEEALRTDPDPATPGMWALGISLAIGAIFLSWAAWHLWIVPWATAGDPITAP